MRFVDEIKLVLGVPRRKSLADIELPQDLEPLKTAIFDHWNRCTGDTLQRAKAAPGQRAFVWGGESPRDPVRLAAILVLAGYQKVIFVDRLSHLFGRDDMLSTNWILDKRIDSVYRRKFISSAVKVYLRALEKLAPFVDAGFVELVPPPVFWSNDANLFVRRAAQLDFQSPGYRKLFDRGVEYRGKGKLDYEGTRRLFEQYNERVKKRSYLRGIAANPDAADPMKGPAEELNEALFGRGFLLKDTNPASFDLVTDRARHWEWLAWKLKNEAQLTRQRFEHFQTLWLDGMSPEGVLEAHESGLLESFRHFFRTELPALCAGNDDIAHICRSWEANRPRIQAELSVLRRKSLRGFGVRVGMVTLTLGLAAPSFLTFPEWLAVTFPAASAALGYSVKDIVGLKRQYQEDRSKIIGSSPLYLLFNVSSTTQADMIPGID